MDLSCWKEASVNTKASFYRLAVIRWQASHVGQPPGDLSRDSLQDNGNSIQMCLCMLFLTTVSGSFSRPDIRIMCVCVCVCVCVCPSVCVFYPNDHAGSCSSALLLQPDLSMLCPGANVFVVWLFVNDESGGIWTHNRLIKSNGSLV